MMSSASGDGSPYDMLEQEELLYTENYPGKLCAFCNLSERSTLGQGDIVKLKISPDDNSDTKVQSAQSESADMKDDQLKSPSNR